MPIDGNSPQTVSKIRQRSRYGSAFRFVAAITVAAFLLQDTGLALVDLNVRSQIDLPTFSVPRNIGVIKETSRADRPETIVNIKDIHDNFGAQESIVHILENLVANYNVRTIGIEGAEGFVDTSLLAALPYADLRQNTAQFLLQEGKLSAGEFLAAMSDGKIAVYGMDDNRLYEENLAAFKANLKSKKDNFLLVDRLTRSLDRAGAAVYSEELAYLNRNGVLNSNGEARFSQRWKEISAMADKYSIGYRHHPNIRNLMESMQAEARIDFKMANAERESLLDVLSKRLERAELEALVLQSVAYKMGRISQGSFSSYLLDLSKRLGQNLSAYPNLVRYADYMLVFEAIDIDGLKDEVRELEDQIREKLYRNDDERQLYRLTKQAEVIRDLFEVKLSSASLAYYKQHQAEFSAAAFRAFLDQKGPSYGATPDPALDLDEIFRRIPEAMKFYETAELRNHALLEGTVRRMKADGQTVACLVTGGFHSRGITELMRQERMSYIVILPRFTKKTNRPYLTLITNSAVSYRDFVASEEVLETKVRMTAHFFAQTAFRSIEKMPMASDSDKSQVIRREIQKAHELYLNAYQRLRVDLPASAGPAATGPPSQEAEPDPGSTPAEHIAVRPYLHGDPASSLESAYAEETFYLYFPSWGYLCECKRSSTGEAQIVNTQKGRQAEERFGALRSLEASKGPAERESVETASDDLTALAELLAKTIREENGDRSTLDERALGQRVATHIRRRGIRLTGMDGSGTGTGEYARVLQMVYNALRTGPVAVQIAATQAAPTRQEPAVAAPARAAREDTPATAERPDTRQTAEQSFEADAAETDAAAEARQEEVLNERAAAAAADGIGVGSAADHDARNAVVRETIESIGREAGVERDEETGRYLFREALVGDTSGRVRTATDRRGRRMHVLDLGNATGTVILLTADGELVLKDSRFDADHYGRTENAVYASTLEMAAHELAELRIWKAALAAASGADAETINRMAADGRLRAWVQALLRQEGAAYQLALAISRLAHEAAARQFGYRQTTGEIVPGLRTVTEIDALSDAVDEAIASDRAVAADAALRAGEAVRPAALLAGSRVAGLDIIGSSQGQVAEVSVDQLLAELERVDAEIAELRGRLGADSATDSKDARKSRLRALTEEQKTLQAKARELTRQEAEARALPAGAQVTDESMMQWLAGLAQVQAGRKAVAGEQVARVYRTKKQFGRREGAGEFVRGDEYVGTPVLIIGDVYVKTYDEAGKVTGTRALTPAEVEAHYGLEQVLDESDPQAKKQLAVVVQEGGGRMFYLDAELTVVIAQDGTIRRTYFGRLAREDIPDLREGDQLRVGNAFEFKGGGTARYTGGDYEEERITEEEFEALFEGVAKKAGWNEAARQDKIRLLSEQAKRQKGVPFELEDGSQVSIQKMNDGSYVVIRRVRHAGFEKGKAGMFSEMRYQAGSREAVGMSSYDGEAQAAYNQSEFLAHGAKLNVAVIKVTPIDSNRDPNAGWGGHYSYGQAYRVRFGGRERTDWADFLFHKNQAGHEIPAETEEHLDEMFENMGVNTRALLLAGYTFFGELLREGKDIDIFGHFADFAEFVKIQGNEDVVFYQQLLVSKWIRYLLRVYVGFFDPAFNRENPKWSGQKTVLDFAKSELFRRYLLALFNGDTARVDAATQKITARLEADAQAAPLTVETARLAIGEVIYGEWQAFLAEDAQTARGREGVTGTDASEQTQSVAQRRQDNTAARKQTHERLEAETQLDGLEDRKEQIASALRQGRKELAQGLAARMNRVDPSAEDSLESLNRLEQELERYERAGALSASLVTQLRSILAQRYARAVQAQMNSAGSLVRQASKRLAATGETEEKLEILRALQERLAAIRDAAVRYVADAPETARLLEQIQIRMGEMEGIRSRLAAESLQRQERLEREALQSRQFELAAAKSEGIRFTEQEERDFLAQTDADSRARVLRDKRKAMEEQRQQAAAAAEAAQAQQMREEARQWDRRARAAAKQADRQTLEQAARQLRALSRRAADRGWKGHSNRFAEEARKFELHVQAIDATAANDAAALEVLLDEVHFLGEIRLANAIASQLKKFAQAELDAAKAEGLAFGAEEESAFLDETSAARSNILSQKRQTKQEDALQAAQEAELHRQQRAHQQQVERDQRALAAGQAQLDKAPANLGEARRRVGLARQQIATAQSALEAQELTVALSEQAIEGMETELAAKERQLAQLGRWAVLAKVTRRSTQQQEEFRQLELLFGFEGVSEAAWTRSSGLMESRIRERLAQLRPRLSEARRALEAQRLALGELTGALTRARQTLSQAERDVTTFERGQELDAAFGRYRELLANVTAARDSKTAAAAWARASAAAAALSDVELPADLQGAARAALAHLESLRRIEAFGQQDQTFQRVFGAVQDALARKELARAADLLKSLERNARTDSQKQILAEAKAGLQTLRDEVSAAIRLRQGAYQSAEARRWSSAQEKLRQAREKIEQARSASAKQAAPLLDQAAALRGEALDALRSLATADLEPAVERATADIEASVRADYGEGISLGEKVTDELRQGFADLAASARAALGPAQALERDIEEVRSDKRDEALRRSELDAAKAEGLSFTAAEEADFLAQPASGRSAVLARKRQAASERAEVLQQQVEEQRALERQALARRRSELAAAKAEGLSFTAAEEADFLAQTEAAARARILADKRRTKEEADRVAREAEDLRLQAEAVSSRANLAESQLGAGRIERALDALTQARAAAQDLPAGSSERAAADARLRQLGIRIYSSKLQVVLDTTAQDRDLSEGAAAVTERDTQTAADLLDGVIEESVSLERDAVLAFPAVTETTAGEETPVRLEFERSIPGHLEGVLAIDADGALTIHTARARLAKLSELEEILSSISGLSPSDARELAMIIKSRLIALGREVARGRAAPAAAVRLRLVDNAERPAYFDRSDGAIVVDKRVLARLDLEGVREFLRFAIVHEFGHQQRSARGLDPRQEEEEVILQEDIPGFLAMNAPRRRLLLSAFEDLGMGEGRYYALLSHLHSVQRRVEEAAAKAKDQAGRPTELAAARAEGLEFTPEEEADFLAEDRPGARRATVDRKREAKKKAAAAAAAGTPINEQPEDILSGVGMKRGEAQELIGQVQGVQGSTHISAGNQILDRHRHRRLSELAGEGESAEDAARAIVDTLKQEGQEDSLLDRAFNLSDLGLTPAQLGEMTVQQLVRLLAEKGFLHADDVNAGLELAAAESAEFTEWVNTHGDPTGEGERTDIASSVRAAMRKVSGFYVKVADPETGEPLERELTVGELARLTLLGRGKKKFDALAASRRATNPALTDQEIAAEAGTEFEAWLSEFFPDWGNLTPEERAKRVTQVLEAFGRESITKAQEIEEQLGMQIDGAGIANRLVIDIEGEALESVLDGVLGRPAWQEILRSHGMEGRTWAEIAADTTPAAAAAREAITREARKQLKGFIESFTEKADRQRHTQKVADALREIARRKFGTQAASTQADIAARIAFAEAAFNLISGYNGMNVAQRVMLGLFLQGKSAGLMAGGGKTAIYLLYQGIMRLTMGNQYSGILFAEDENGVGNYITGEFGGGTHAQLAEAFGLTVRNGNTLHADHEYDAIGRILNSPSELLVLDFTTGAHLNNYAVKENPQLRDAILERQDTRVGTVDEMHLLAVSKNAAVLGGEGRAFEAKEMERVVDVAQRLFDFRHFRAHGNAEAAFKARGYPTVYAYSRSEQRRLVEEYSRRSEAVIIVFKPGKEEDVKVSRALAEEFEDIVGRVGGSAIVSSVIRGLRAQEGDQYTAVEDPNHPGRMVVAPLGEKGEPQFNSVMQDTDYQAAIALKIIVSGQYDGVLPQDHTRLRERITEEAAKMVRLSDTSMQVAVTDAIGMFAFVMVGASGTVSGLEDLAHAHIGAGVVDINASKMDLGSYHMLNETGRLRETIASAREALTSGRIPYKDAAHLERDLKLLDTLEERLSSQDPADRRGAQIDLVVFSVLHRIQFEQAEQADQGGRAYRPVRSHLVAIAGQQMRREVQERLADYEVEVETLDSYTNQEDEKGVERIVENAGKSTQLTRAEKALAAARAAHEADPADPAKKAAVEAAERRVQGVIDGIRDGTIRPIGKIILISRLGWTGRNYKTVDGVHGAKIKNGIDLTVMGFEEMAETEFIQLTRRNRRQTRLGDRFLVLDDASINERLTDFSEKEIREELMKKWRILPADLEQARLEGAPDYPQRLVLASAVEKAVKLGRARNAEHSARLAVDEALQEVTAAEGAFEEARKQQKGIREARRDLRKAKKALSRAREELRQTAAQAKQAMADFTFTERLALHARLLATREISDGARFSVQDTLKNRAVADPFKPLFENRGLRFAWKFTDAQKKALEEAFKNALTDRSQDADIIARLTELTGKHGLAAGQLLIVLEQAEKAWKQVLEHPQFSAWRHPVAHLRARAILWQIRRAKKDVPKWQTEVSARRSALQEAEANQERAREAFETASKAYEEDPTAERLEAVRRAELELARAETQVRRLRAEGVSDFRQARKKAKSAGGFFSILFRGRGEVYATIKNTFEVADNVADGNVVQTSRDQAGLLARSENITIQVNNQHGKKVKTLRRVRATLTPRGIQLDLPEHELLIQEQITEAVVEAGGLRLTIQTEHGDTFEHLIPGEEFALHYAVGTRLEGQMQSGAKGVGRSIYLQRTQTTLNPQTDSADAALKHQMSHDSFLALARSLYSLTHEELTAFLASKGLLRDGVDPGQIRERLEERGFDWLNARSEDLVSELGEAGLLAQPVAATRTVIEQERRLRAAKAVTAGSLEEMAVSLRMSWDEFSTALRTRVALFTKIVGHATTGDQDHPLSEEDSYAAWQMAEAFNPLLAREKADQDDWTQALLTALTDAQTPASGTALTREERLARLAQNGLAVDPAQFKDKLGKPAKVDDAKRIKRRDRARAASDQARTQDRVRHSKRWLVQEADRLTALPDPSPDSLNLAAKYYAQALLDADPAERVILLEKLARTHERLAEQALAEAARAGENLQDLQPFLTLVQHHARLARSARQQQIQLRGAQGKPVSVSAADPGLDLLKRAALLAHARGNHILALHLARQVLRVDPETPEFNQPDLNLRTLTSASALQQARLREQAQNLRMAGRPSATEADRDNPNLAGNPDAAVRLLLPFVALDTSEADGLEHPAPELVKLFAEVHRAAQGRVTLAHSPALSRMLREQARTLKRSELDKDRTRWLLTAAEQADPSDHWVGEALAETVVSAQPVRTFLAEVLPAALKKRQDKTLTAEERALVTRAARVLGAPGAASIGQLLLVNPGNRKSAEAIVAQAQRTVNGALQALDPELIVRGGVNSRGELNFHTSTVTTRQHASVTQRTLSQIPERERRLVDEGAEKEVPLLVVNQLDLLEDKGTNVAQQESDGTLIIFEHRIASWTEDTILPKISGEETEFYDRLEADLERMERGEEPLYFFLTKDGGLAFVKPLTGEKRYPKMASALRSINLEHQQEAEKAPYRLNPEHPKDRKKLIGQLQELVKHKAASSRTLTKLFKREFPDAVGDNREVVGRVLWGFFQHELQHIVDKLNGIDEIWRKKGGLEHQKVSEISSHLRSMSDSNTPFFFLGQVLTYMLLQTSGEGYTLASNEIMRLLARGYRERLKKMDGQTRRKFRGTFKHKSSTDRMHEQWNRMVDGMVELEADHEGLLREVAGDALKRHLGKELKKLKKKQKGPDGKPLVSTEVTEPALISRHDGLTPGGPPPKKRELSHPQRTERNAAAVAALAQNIEDELRRRLAQEIAPAKPPAGARLGEELRQALDRLGGSFSVDDLLRIRAQQYAQEVYSRGVSVEEAADEFTSAALDLIRLAAQVDADKTADASFTARVRAADDRLREQYDDVQRSASAAGDGDLRPWGYVPLSGRSFVLQEREARKPETVRRAANVQDVFGIVFVSTHTSAATAELVQAGIGINAASRDPVLRAWLTRRWGGNAALNRLDAQTASRARPGDTVPQMHEMASKADRRMRLAGATESDAARAYFSGDASLIGAVQDGRGLIRRLAERLLDFKSDAILRAVVTARPDLIRDRGFITMIEEAEQQGLTPERLLRIAAYLDRTASKASQSSKRVMVDVKGESTSLRKIADTLLEAFSGGYTAAGLEKASTALLDDLEVPMVALTDQPIPLTRLAQGLSQLPAFETMAFWVGMAPAGEALPVEPGSDHEDFNKVFPAHFRLPTAHLSAGSDLRPQPRPRLELSAAERQARIAAARSRADLSSPEGRRAIGRVDRIYDRLIGSKRKLRERLSALGMSAADTDALLTQVKRRMALSILNQGIDDKTVRRQAEADLKALESFVYEEGVRFIRLDDTEEGKLAKRVSADLRADYDLAARVFGGPLPLDFTDPMRAMLVVPQGIYRRIRVEARGQQVSLSGHPATNLEAIGLSVINEAEIADPERAYELLYHEGGHSVTVGFFKENWDEGINQASTEQRILNQAAADPEKQQRLLETFQRSGMYREFVAQVRGRFGPYFNYSWIRLAHYLGDAALLELPEPSAGPISPPSVPGVSLPSAPPTLTTPPASLPAPPPGGLAGPSGARLSASTTPDFRSTFGSTVGPVLTARLGSEWTGQNPINRSVGTAGRTLAPTGDAVAAERASSLTVWVDSPGVREPEAITAQAEALLEPGGTLVAVFRTDRTGAQNAAPWAAAMNRAGWTLGVSFAETLAPPDGGQPETIQVLTAVSPVSTPPSATPVPSPIPPAPPAGRLEPFAAQPQPSGAEEVGEPEYLIGLGMDADDPDADSILQKLSQTYPRMTFVITPRSAERSEAVLSDAAGDQTYAAQVHVDLGSADAGTAEQRVSEAEQALASVRATEQTRQFVLMYPYLASLDRESLRERLAGGRLEAAYARIRQAMAGDIRAVDLDAWFAGSGLTGAPLTAPRTPKASVLRLDETTLLEESLRGAPLADLRQSADPDVAQGEAFVGAFVRALASRDRGLAERLAARLAAFLQGRKPDEAAEILARHERIAIAQGWEADAADRWSEWIVANRKPGASHVIAFDMRTGTGLPGEAGEGLASFAERMRPYLTDPVRPLRLLVMVDASQRGRYASIQGVVEVLTSPGETIHSKLKQRGLAGPDAVIVTGEAGHSQAIAHLQDKDEEEKANFVVVGEEGLEGASRYAPVVALASLMKRPQGEKPLVVLLAASTRVTSAITALESIVDVVKITRINIAEILNSFLQSLRQIAISA